MSLLELELDLGLKMELELKLELELDSTTRAPRFGGSTGSLPTQSNWGTAGGDGIHGAVEVIRAQKKKVFPL